MKIFMGTDSLLAKKLKDLRDDVLSNKPVVNSL